MGLDARKMTLFDCHVNADSTQQQNIRKYCAQARQQGLDGFCLTEPVVFSKSERTIKLPQFPAKEHSDLEILTGLEIEFTPETHASMALRTAGLNPDYIINAVHSADGLSLRDMEYYTSQSRTDAYSNYLTCVFDSLDAAFEYSVLGHITYVSKYAYYPSPALEWREFPDILDNILMRTVFMGKGLELNASAYASEKLLMPSLSVLKRYRELGGEILTFGSGAHSYLHVGAHMHDMCEAAISCGFKYYTVFKKMRPQMYPL